MLRSSLFAAACAAALAAVPAAAQDHDHHGPQDGTPAPAPSPAPSPAPAPQDHQEHSQHDRTLGDEISDKKSFLLLPGSGCRMGDAGWSEEGGHSYALACKPLTGSGTSRLPPLEGGMHGGHGSHLYAGNWRLMLHGSVWGVYTDQGGARGDDMAFVESMAMVTAERMIDEEVRLQLRTMMSLEPAMGARGYPNLFATGETAGGRPLIDRQHPHDLFMELSSRLDWNLGEDRSVFLYGGPVGEPALGPSAFMHRRSARYLALAPITHHWFDSTHITYGVVTAGYSAQKFQIEASVFRGREPDEERWGIETPALDSWSVRASFQPSWNWLIQLSHGRLKEPEAMHPGQDEARTTASAQYAGSSLSATLAFSAKNRLPGDTLTAWLAEANWSPGGGHNIFGRIENVANDELFPDHGDPLHDRKFRVTRFESGYAYRIDLGDYWAVALGGSVASYAKPAALDAAYGRDPFSYTLFARLSLGD